jgi:hypothetical protein
MLTLQSLICKPNLQLGTQPKCGDIINLKICCKQCGTKLCVVSNIVC